MARLDFSAKKDLPEFHTFGSDRVIRYEEWRNQSLY